MEKTNFKTTTYKTNYGDRHKYYVNIAESSYGFEVWLYRENYSVQSFMFGFPKPQVSFEEVLEITENNLPEYIEDYEKENCN